MSDFEELRALAAQGDPEGLFSLGLEYAKYGNFDNGVRSWQLAAEKGYKEAERLLAQIGPEADTDTALRLLSELGDDSDPFMLRTKVELGMLYCNSTEIVWAPDKGWKLLDEVTQRVDIKDLPPFIIAGFADIFARGIPSGGGVENPSVDDLIKAVKYFSLAIDLAKADGGKDITKFAIFWRKSLENCVNRLIIKPGVEVGKRFFGMEEKPKEQILDELIKERGLEQAPDKFQQINKEIEKEREAQEDIIIEELKKHGLDNIADRLEREWEGMRETQKHKLEGSQDGVI